MAISARKVDLVASNTSGIWWPHHFNLAQGVSSLRSYEPFVQRKTTTLKSKHKPANSAEVNQRFLQDLESIVCYYGRDLSSKNYFSTGTRQAFIQCQCLL